MLTLLANQSGIVLNETNMDFCFHNKSLVKITALQKLKITSKLI